MDFSKWKSRSHNLVKIMTNDKGKTNQELYDTAVEARDKKQALYNAALASDVNMNKFDQILKLGTELQELNKKVKELEKIKDNPRLSQGCKSHLMDVYTADTYGVNMELKNKYFEKGIEVEEDSITLYSIANEIYYEKNKVRKENDYVSGETDFRMDGESIVRDTKATWDIFDFWRKLAKPLSPTYWWQDQSYMWLWDCEEARTIFTLIDTPERLIKKEKDNLFYKFASTEAYEKACEDLEKMLKFTDIPMDEKVIEFSVKRDQSAIDSIPARVEECRKYLSSIKRVNIIK